LYQLEPLPVFITPFKYMTKWHKVNYYCGAFGPQDMGGKD